MVRHMVEVETLFEIEEGAISPTVISVGEFIQRVTSCLAALPEEQRATAVIRMWASGDASAYIEMHRAETAEETARREAAEADQARAYRAACEAEEARIYQHLKAKFEAK